mmetsp:Transcript_24840/g.17550  ORF Transcript_24840/g.17550 Transcript_24840/m.17550 type:complete len:80 (-) Transcript_24840:66-305(-)
MDAIKKDKWSEWVTQYKKLLSEQKLWSDDNQKKQSMDRVNPIFICRNYLLQEAIEKAEKHDYSGVHKLLAFSKDPYTDK